MELVSNIKCFEGNIKRYKHKSECLGCEMHFSTYIPPKSHTNKKPPVLYILSGLTCTDENFIIKAGAQRKASELNLALIAPDTSPRGLNIEGESDSYDFGVGAGFYLNATQMPWKKNWQMETYIIDELPKLINENLKDELDLNNVSIMGHSMGGHGALTLGLKYANKFKSISAFAPICNPINCPWGQKAFSKYLGEDKSKWNKYDSCELMKELGKEVKLPILIDFGTCDKFLDEQLKPHALIEICEKIKYPSFKYRLLEGYDHSYFFVSTFIDDHFYHHGKALNLMIT